MWPKGIPSPDALIRHIERSHLKDQDSVNFCVRTTLDRATSSHSSIVTELKRKYCEGTSSKEFCPNCGRKFQCLTQGVFENGGAVMVYCNDMVSFDKCLDFCFSCWKLSAFALTRVFHHIQKWVPNGWVCCCHYWRVCQSVQPNSDMNWTLCLCFTEGICLESNSLEQCQWLYDVYTHYGIGLRSWFFTLNQVSVLVRFLTTRDLHGVSKRLMGMFT